MFYCYICNARMRSTIYVCRAHEYDPQTREAVRYILSADSAAMRLGARTHGWAPTLDLTPFGIGVDPDLCMDVGL